MAGRVLIACAIVLAVSRVANAQGAAPPPQPYQLQPAPTPAPAPAPTLAPPLAPPPAAYPPGPVRTRSMIMAEISALEAQRRQYSLALPIGLLIGGGLAALNGGTLLVIGLLLDSANDSLCDDPYYDSYPYEDDDCTTDDLAQVYIIGGAVAAGVGVVLLVIGGTLLSGRTGPRRELGNRIKALRQELQWTVAGLPLSMEPVANGAALRLSF